MNWTWRGIVSGLGGTLATLVDRIGVGEVWDRLFRFIKPNSRPLTTIEEAEARLVFKHRIRYPQVRLDEFSLLAVLGALFRGGGGMGVTTFHTINFNRRLHCAAGNFDMCWLIHELTHVVQYEQVGARYIGQALLAQSKTGCYDYGGPEALGTDCAAGRRLCDYNREQQGDIVRDYYRALKTGAPTTLYQPLIDQLWDGGL